MKKHTPKLLAMLLVICLLFGMIPAAFAAVPQTLYLKPSSNWKVDGARFAAYFWNTAGGTAWASATDSDGDGYYEVSVPAQMTYVIFARMNGSAAENSWDNKWNQTEDLAIPTDGTNCFTITEGAWDGNESTKIGSWSTYGNAPVVTDPTEPSTPTTPSTPTDPTTPSTPVDPDIPSAADNIQDGMTLHCWNWSYADIEKNMALIASQGYTAVQTSPIQQAKEATVGNGMKSHWWVYYQPMGFHIDQTSGNAMGTKDDFISMCNTAHEYGVKVIVDVVANHLGNRTGNNLADTIIDDLKNDSSCWHDITINTTNYNDRYDITQHCMAGLPDLNTASKKVQNYALNFLKECIDAGVDGFRFDGAKHIETPEDSGCGSDFWPTVINGATEYAKSTRGIDLYCYGEVLDSPGGSLPISAYTKYMSVTDNSWGNSLRGSINGGNAGGYNPSYHKGAAAKKLVVWVESHDTYANEGSGNVSDANVNKTWALIAARSDVMGLYFARPSNYASQKLGEGSVTAWSYPEVKAVNEFHNLFVGTTEYVSNQNGIAYCERGTSGVILVNCGGTTASVSVTAHTMADGSYIDTITGNTFTVSGGKISGQIGSTGIAVVYSGKAPCTHPSHNQSGICSECGGKASHTYVNGFCSVCGAERPAISGDYYLFGWINGANYGCEEDAANLGQYKLVGGTLTTTFAQDSYVAVKSADNSRWYMTDGFPGMTATTATLYNTTTLGTTADKLYVPGGVEVTFTLIDNGDDTFTLSYAPAGQACEHTYADATCTAPKTCTKCGETTGSALGHSYTDATCSAPKTCTVCGATDGSALGHSYADATCSAPKTCTVCGATDGNALGHSYASTVTAPTCEANGFTTYTCSACGDSYVGDEVAALGHDWTAATCTAPKTCTTCGATEGEFGHKFNGGYCMLCGEKDPGSETPSAVTLAGSSFTLSFEDEILVNFYYTVSDTTDVVEQGMLVFYTDPGTASFETADAVYSENIYDSANDRYMSTTAGIAAKEMGDDRYYCAYAKLSDGTFAYSKLYQYSPKKYATNMLAKDSTSAAQKALCVAMLNYGAAAQNYFGHNTDNLMNSALTAEQKALNIGYDASLFTGAVAADPSKIGSFAATATGFSKKTATVSFEGAFSVNYYFNPSEALNGALTLYCWTPADYAAADVLSVDNASGTMAMADNGNGSYWGQVSGIAAKMLDETYYVAGVYTDTAGNSYCTGVIAYSLSRYCMNNASGDMGELAQATAMYGYYADLYFAN